MQTGRTLEYEDAKERNLSAFFLSVLDRMGAPLSMFGSATEQLVGV